MIIFEVADKKSLGAPGSVVQTILVFFQTLMFLNLFKKYRILISKHMSQCFFIFIYLIFFAAQYGS